MAPPRPSSHRLDDECVLPGIGRPRDACDDRENRERVCELNYGPRKFHRLPRRLPTGRSPAAAGDPTTIVSNTAVCAASDGGRQMQRLVGMRADTTTAVWPRPSEVCQTLPRLEREPATACLEGNHACSGCPHRPGGTSR